jgi:F-type H+-transporting ATPase subunit alpha
MRTAHADVINTLVSGQLTDDATQTIENVMADIAGQYK